MKLFLEFNLDFVYVLQQQFELQFDVPEKSRHIFAFSLPRERKRL